MKSVLMLIIYFPEWAGKYFQVIWSVINVLMSNYWHECGIIELMLRKSQIKDYR